MARTRFRSDAPAQSSYQGVPVRAREVLDVVDSIPAGMVMTYGDIAEYLALGSPRVVARMMRLYGAEVPWWRVLRADGTCAAEVIAKQLPLLGAEGTPMRGPERVDMVAARFDPSTST